MQANPRIDVIPGPYSTGTETLHTDDPRITRQRWRLLLVTFLVTAIIGLSYVWLRAPLYQSYAILHLSYSQPDLEAISGIANEQLNIHHQRLTSQRVIGLLAEELVESKQLHFTLEQLNDILSVAPITDSRLLKLSATDTTPLVLLPIVETWMELYVALQAGEQQADSSDAVADLQGKLASLEDKVAAKRLVLADFTTEHEIVSLERDESSLLNQIKGLSKALDVAAEEKATASGTMQAIKSTVAEGKIMVRPQDQRSLDNMEDRALALEEQLFQLSQQFTPEYMALDPQIVGINNNLASLRDKIAARQSQSQQTYLDEVQRAVQAGSLKEADIRKQLVELQSRAQAFSHRLSEYAGMSLGLDQLQLQTQMIRDQIIEAEVRKPFQASIDILEPPMQPGFPIGPNYTRDSGLALLLAVMLSLLTLGIYTLINRQHRPGIVLSTYSNHPQPQVVQEQLATDSRTGISYQQARELTVGECRSLLESAPLHCKLALTLMLSGVSANELLRLDAADFDEKTRQLMVPGQHQRRLTLPELTLETFKRIRADSNTGLWATPAGEQLTLPELELMLEHASEDAGLNEPEPVGFKDIRLGYLLFLARQGGKLNDIEQTAGYLSATEMTQCRQIEVADELTQSAVLATAHPALVQEAVA